MSHYDEFRISGISTEEFKRAVTQDKVQEQLNMIFNELSEIYKMLEELKLGVNGERI